MVFMKQTSKHTGSAGSIRGSMRISIRISSQVTSLSIKKNLIAIWILLMNTDPEDSRDDLTEFVYKCLDQWTGDSAKGFSDFVSERLIQDMLEADDYIEYKQILGILI